MLSTAIGRGIPKVLRGHVYHIFFGGFQHLEGRRYYGQIDFKHIIQSADVEQDEDIMDENIKIMD